MVSLSPKILSDLGEKQYRLVLVNCVITQGNNGEEGTYYVNQDRQPHVPPVKYLTDEQTVAMLKAVVGRDKPIDKKQLWAGAYWFLRWACNFPVDPCKFCKRINAMCGVDALEIPCCYNNIRRLAFLSFMAYDPRMMEDVRFSNNDRNEYSCCREVALALIEIMVKMGL